MRTDVGLINLLAGVRVPGYVSMSHAVRRTLLFFLVASASTNQRLDQPARQLLPRAHSLYGQQRRLRCRCCDIWAASQRAARALGIFALVSLLGGLSASCASAWHLCVGVSTQDRTGGTFLADDSTLERDEISWQTDWTRSCLRLVGMYFGVGWSCGAFGVFGAKMPRIYKFRVYNSVALNWLPPI